MTRSYLQILYRLNDIGEPYLDDGDDQDIDCSNLKPKSLGFIIPHGNSSTAPYYYGEDGKVHIAKHKEAS